MAARRNPAISEAHRERIRTSQLINRLQANALGTLEITPIQQKSAEILLRKVLPDLSQVAVNASVATYVARLPAPAVDITAWSQSIEHDQPVTSALPIESQPIDNVELASVSETQSEQDQDT